MRRSLTTLVARGMLLALALTHGAGAAPRVVLIGLDGASWNVIDPMVAEGRLPHIAALIERGIHAELATVEPVISPVVWSSVATGRAPEAHGVGNFFDDSRDVRVPTVFERLAAQGLKVGAYDWLVSWPPQALPGGFVVPGWLRRDETVHPPDVFARAEVPPYVYTNQGLHSRGEFFETSFRETREKPRRFTALAQHFGIDAGAVCFYAIDALSHRFWAESFPGGFDPEDLRGRGLEEEFRLAVQKGYEAIDGAVGEVVASLPPEATVLVASDHGFEALGSFERRWAFDVEDELARAGLVAGREAFAFEGQFGFVIVRVESGPFEEREPLLEKLAAFFGSARNEAGAPLFNVVTFDAAERPAGFERPLLERLRQWVYAAAARLLFSTEFDDEAHARLVMIPEDDAWESAFPHGRVRLGALELAAREVVYGDGFTGGHHPTAVFLAAGGAVQPLRERQRLSVLDVAPLFLHLAGGALPDDLEGQLREEWLAPGWTAQHPVRRVSSESIPRLPPPVGPAHGDRVLIERLRSMGYIE